VQSRSDAAEMLSTRCVPIWRMLVMRHRCRAGTFYETEERATDADSEKRMSSLFAILTAHRKDFMRQLTTRCCCQQAATVTLLTVYQQVYRSRRRRFYYLKPEIIIIMGLKYDVLYPESCRRKFKQSHRHLPLFLTLRGSKMT